MSEYYNVTTNAGDAAIATAIANNNKLNITHVAFGDGNGSVPTPNKTRSSLVHEVHRQAVTKYAKHPSIANFIIIETIIPSDIGGFWIREMGIIADNVLISHGSHAPFFKVADPEGVSEYRLKFTQDVRDGSVVEIVLDESLIYASQAWVNENYIRRNEIVNNLTTDDAAKPLSARQGKALQDNKFDKSGGILSGEININTGESSAIKTVINAAGSITVNKPNELAAINHAISFNWYKTEFQIGNVRSASQDSDGFGITKKNNELLLLVKENGDLYNFGDIRCSKYIYAAKFIGELGGNASSASKLQDTRNISFNGAATGSIDFDGSANASCLLTLANSGVIAGTYASTIQIPQINVNNKGLITSVSQQNIRSATTGQTGVVQLTDDLATDDSSRALTARQGKALQDNKFDKSGGTLSGEININTGESSAIKTVVKSGSSTGDINHAISFNWYDTEYLIGNIRGGSTDSIGFGIKSKNGNTIFVVDDSSTLYATQFTGNATTATKLKTSRNIALSGAVSGSANFDGSGNITITTTANNAIGVGQSWSNVTSQRANNTTYTNTTGRPIQLFISVNVGGQGDDIGTFNIDGVVMTIRDAAAWSHLSFIIPNGSSYKLSVNASQYNLLTWAELR